ncbi:MAG: MBL fold metallo-hydrolase [Lachnospiraceae bacterium]|nr:MBL fold metallo-hydrolase [Lachnospiraceae bacterium]
MKVCSIASGSSGNCIYIGSKEHHILIDAGISRKRIVEGLRNIGVEPEQLDGIFVTHEHSDHIQGIPMMAKQFGTPIYATGGTLDCICAKDTDGVIRRDSLFQVYADKPVGVGDFHITPYRISHDAAEPVCYSVEAQGHKVSIATDLGVYDEYTVENLAGSEILLLEANHDVSMLEAGSYPYSLKYRILGEQGHLSNEDSGRLLCRLMGSHLRYVFLAHLSKENNYPALAYEAVKCQIWEEMGLKEVPFALEVAERDKPSALVSL